MEQHIMYVVKNEAGEYLTHVFRKGEIIDIRFMYFGPYVIYHMRKALADNLCEQYGGTVKQVQLIISDTPVSF